MLSIIKKRDGRFVKFDENKIHSAVYKAMCAVGKPDSKVAIEVANEVVKTVKTDDLDVEHIQDLVEVILIEKGFTDVAKTFIIYRDEQRRLREEKCKVLNKTSLDEVDKAFDINALGVLAARYLIRDDTGKIVESPKELFIRVATHIGLAEIFYDKLLFTGESLQMKVGTNWAEEAEEYYEKIENFADKFHIGKYKLNKFHFEALIRQYVTMFNSNKIKSTFKRVLELLATGYLDKYEPVIDTFYDLMVNRIFLPNTPTLMNAGSKLGQLSACFVLDVDDSLDSIMRTAYHSAKIFQSGGGIGINYSKLRPEGDMVFSTSGVASGPVSFMNIINTVTEVVKQGGKRRGANMGILHCHHPDIEKFITAKTVAGVLENFNVSVGLWEPFWKAYKEGGKYDAINPRDGKVIRQVDAKQLMDNIALSAWRSAEPGMIFFDNINKHNHMIKARGGPINCTNPCGEQSLYPYESCNLGSINLAKFVFVDTDDKPQFNWDEFEKVIRITIRFLDDVIDANKYPIEEIQKASHETRRIGLGIMGLADALYMLKVPYNSEAGYQLMDLMAETLSYISTDESIELSRIRGEFPLFAKSDMVNGQLSIAGIFDKPHMDWKSLVEKVKRYGIRNSWTTTIAPTGSLSMIADCSNGVEPVFSLAFEKKVAVGNFIYANKIFKDSMLKAGIYNDKLVAKIASNYGCVKGIEEVPKDLQETFVTAMDIHWLDHVVAQAVWQRWIGNAIAKTINMPEDATTEDIKTAYILSHDLGLKGVTVYRDNSRHAQVLHVQGERNKNFNVSPSQGAIEYAAERGVLPEKYQPVLTIGHDLTITNENTVRQPTITEFVDVPGEPLIVSVWDKSQVIGNKNEEECECGGKLVKQGGCALCIDCGISSCTVG